MVDGHLAAPVFEITNNSQPVSPANTPWLHNDGGTPRYLASSPQNPAIIDAAATDPMQAHGRPIEGTRP